MGGDKIVLLDGAGANGGGAATNGLLSMIPGMFANLIGGNKMDPNLVAALMNGRNNQDWSRLRAVPAPAKGTPSPGWGQLGRGNDVRVKYVSINSGLGGDRL